MVVTVTATVAGTTIPPRSPKRAADARAPARQKGEYAQPGGDVESRCSSARLTGRRLARHLQHLRHARDEIALHPVTIDTLRRSTRSTTCARPLPSPSGSPPLPPRLLTAGLMTAAATACSSTPSTNVAVPTSIAVVSGAGQTGTVGTALPTPLVVAGQGPERQPGPGDLVDFNPAGNSRQRQRGHQRRIGPRIDHADPRHRQRR